jgi:hypothetical protein
MADILYAGCAGLVQHLFTRLDTVISTGVAKTPQRHTHFTLGSASPPRFIPFNQTLSFPPPRTVVPWKVMHATGDILFIAMANICDIGKR